MIGVGQAEPAADLIKDATIESFEQDVIMASMEAPVIVDFWADWCGPCKQLAPALESAVMEAGGKIRLVKVDIDKNQMLASQLRIQSIPTVYAFFQGRPLTVFKALCRQAKLTRSLTGSNPCKERAGADRPWMSISMLLMKL